MHLPSAFARLAPSIAWSVAFLCFRPEGCDGQVARIELHPIETKTLTDSSWRRWIGSEQV
jgi:hypothetical protein